VGRDNVHGLRAGIQSCCAIHQINHLGKQSIYWWGQTICKDLSVDKLSQAIAEAGQIYS
jgi:hypothetical protein